MKIKTVIAVLGLLVFEPALAQDRPLKVEIVTNAPHQRDPIVAHVTNLTTEAMQLALPFLWSSNFGVRPAGHRAKKAVGLGRDPIHCGWPSKEFAADRSRRNEGIRIWRSRCR
jgi:hypothetical protein